MEDKSAGVLASPILTPDILSGIENQTQVCKDDVANLYKNILIECPNGKITKERLNRIMRTCFQGQYVDELDIHIFRVYDLNQDGVIDAHESLAAITLMGSGTVEEKLEQIFRIYDINNDGAICKGEWRRIFRILSNWQENRRTMDEEIARKISAAYM